MRTAAGAAGAAACSIAQMVWREAISVLIQRRVAEND